MSDLKITFNEEQMKKIDKIDKAHRELFNKNIAEKTIDNQLDWLHSLKVGDKVCYEQRIKFFVEREQIIAEVSEIICDGWTVARLDNGVPIDIHGNAAISECFGVDKVPVQLYID